MTSHSSRSLCLPPVPNGAPAPILRASSERPPNSSGLNRRSWPPSRAETAATGDPAGEVKAHFGPPLRVLRPAAPRPATAPSHGPDSAKPRRTARPRAAPSPAEVIIVPPARPAEGGGARSAALRSGSAAPLLPLESPPRLCRSAATRPGSAAEAPFRQGLSAAGQRWPRRSPARKAVGNQAEVGQPFPPGRSGGLYALRTLKARGGSGVTQHCTWRLAQLNHAPPYFKDNRMAN